MTTHYLPQRLPPVESLTPEGLFSTNPDGRLVVFVHGFNGSASATWLDFPGLFPRRPKFERADALFVGYDSLRTPATVSAAGLRQFMRRLWTAPSSIINAALDPDAARDSGFRYRKATLVAHSLGSIVARQAIVDGLRESPSPDEWATTSQLILFAPAHKGAKTLELAMECLAGLSWLGALVGPLLKMRYQTLSDLEQDSKTLEILEADAVKLHERGHAAACAQKVVWARNDHTVWALKFGVDPPAEVIENKGHTDVCKPSAAYLRPMEILEAAL